MGGTTSAGAARGDLWPRSVLICGGGNGGHALSVVLSQHAEVRVDWLVGSDAKAALLTEKVARNGLRATGVVTGTADRLHTITADPAEVVPNADLILITVPAYCHAGVLERIAPHVRSTAAVGCLPTRGGFEFDARRLRWEDEDEGPVIFGLQTLPWSTRVTSPGETVNFGVAKARVVLASLPSSAASELARTLTNLLAIDVVAVDSILNLTLGNPGQFIHPGLMYGHFHAWGGQEYTAAATPKFYAGATEAMGEVVASLSLEAVAVAREVEGRSDSALNLARVVPVIDWLRESYAHATEDTTTVATCFRTGPIQARLAPMIEVQPGAYVPDFGYRYLAEDVPYGLVVTRAIAELVKVDTPTIDNVILWAQSVMSRDWLVGGRLCGRDVSSLPIPQNYGIHAFEDLIRWYRGGTSPVRAERLVYD